VFHVSLVKMVEEILNIELNDKEKLCLQSADAVRQMNDARTF
jgi:hypothetical protein